MTATVFKARVWELATVTGTGSVSLVGTSQQGYQNFAANVPSGSLVCYTIYDPTAYAWEVGIGIYTVTTAPAGTLTRNVSESSNANALVSFAGNTCNVTLDMLSPVQTSAGVLSAGLIPALGQDGLLDPSMIGPYSIPKLANFTVDSAPSGFSASDTNSGLNLLFTGSSGTLGALLDDIPPGSTFNLTAGANASILAGQNSYFGLYVKDASGKFVVLGANANEGATLAAQFNYQNNFSSYSSTPVVTTWTIGLKFLKIQYDGTNFNLFAGSDVNAMLPFAVYSATAWIGTPVGVGLIIQASGATSTTYFHYNHGP